MTDNEKPTSGSAPTKGSAINKDKTAANTNTETKPTSEKENKSNLSKRLLIILLIFLSGSAVTIYFMPTIQERLPFVANWIGTNDNENLATLNERINQQQSQIDQLTQKSAELESRLQGGSSSESEELLSQIEERIVALEQTNNIEAAAQSNDEMAEEEVQQVTDTSQAARIDMLLSRMSQLEASFVPLSKSMIDGARAEQERETLKEENVALSDKVSELGRRLDNVERVAAKDNSALLLTLKINELKRKLNSGLPFENELNDVTDLVSNSNLSGNSSVSDALGYLSQYSQEGLVTAEELRQEFNGLIPSLISTKGIVDDAGWWDATISRIKNMITVRRTGQINSLDDSVDGMIAQIEQWLSSRELSAITDLIETLPDAMRTILQDWEDALDSWLDSQDAVNNLESIATESFLVNQESAPEVGIEAQL